MQHLPRIQRPNTAFQQVGAYAGAGNERTAVGHTQQNHHRLRIGCHGDRQARQNNLRGGDGDDDKGGRPGLLAGVEDAQVEQHNAVGDQRERGQRHRQPNGSCCRHRESPIGVQCHPDLRAEHQHEHHNGQDADHGEFGGDGEVPHHTLRVVVGGVAGQPRHDGRKQRHPNNAVGHLQQQPRLRIHARCRIIGHRGDAVSDEIAGLADGHIHHNGDAHPRELLNAAIDTPLGAQVNTNFAEWRNEHDRLHHHTQGGAQAQNEHVDVGEGAVVVGGQTTGNHPVEGDEKEDNNVIPHGRPRPRLEHTLRVEDGHEQGGYAVEKDLRQHQVGEVGGLVDVHFAAGVQAEAGEQRRSSHAHHRHHNEQHTGHGDEPADEGGAVVRVLLFCAHQHGHHQAGEHGAQDDLGDEVRKLVGGVKGGEHGSAEAGAQQGGFDEAGDAAEEGGDSHGAGGAQDVAVAVFAGGAGGFELLGALDGAVGFFTHGSVLVRCSAG